ncbi:hypothetical protein CEXT_404891 [Caerostris extrusa]|uniref:Uncharacterized protein n=1 Tax=Caerostris extrusa TaxID=172846 RepID=A0AAV4NSR0_CAEEX|nr:hypothetical protein CEXT_404891 [Caerostris extrusa]
MRKETRIPLRNCPLNNAIHLSFQNSQSGKTVFILHKREKLWREELSCISFFRLRILLFFWGRCRTPSIASPKEETLESPRILTIPTSREKRGPLGNILSCTTNIIYRFFYNKRIGFLFEWVASGCDITSTYRSEYSTMHLVLVIEIHDMTLLAIFKPLQTHSSVCPASFSYRKPFLTIHQTYSGRYHQLRAKVLSTYTYNPCNLNSKHPRALLFTRAERTD